MQFFFDDGGRKRAGFQGLAGDCVARAFTILLERSYVDVYRELALLEKMRGKAKSARNGVSVKTPAFKAWAKAQGLEWVPIMGIGSGVTVHLKADELPQGRIVVRLSRHVAAVINGKIFDTHDPSRNGTRAVYGYWKLS